MLSRVRTMLALRRRRRGYQSRFGGLWTDRLDAAAELTRRRAAGLSDEDAERLEHWMVHGYVVLPNAVPEDVLDRIDGDVRAAWETVDGRVKIELDGEVQPLVPALRGERYKLVDLYAHSSAALEAAFAEPIRRFLQLVFDDDVLLFQSLSFERGSEQPIHQDTAYVVVAPPMALAASWIALEDVRPGSGELCYYPGSHRFPERIFRGGARNWNRRRDGPEARDRYEDGLHAEARARGIELETFRPRKGDALIWSADLAHGGSRIADESLTRRSLVSHYCPASARPYYTSYVRGSETRRSFAPGCLYASSHHDLAAPPGSERTGGAPPRDA